MRKKIIIWMFILFVCSGCSTLKTLKPDSPRRNAALFIDYMSAEQYEQVEGLFAETKRGIEADKTIQTLKGLDFSSGSWGLYNIITLHDGSMVFVKLVEEKGEYHIVDAVKVPEELKEQITKSIDKAKIK